MKYRSLVTCIVGVAAVVAYNDHHVLNEDLLGQHMDSDDRSTVLPLPRELANVLRSEPFLTRIRRRNKIDGPWHDVGPDSSLMGEQMEEATSWSSKYGYNGEEIGRFNTGRHSHSRSSYFSQDLTKRVLKVSDNAMGRLHVKSLHESPEIKPITPKAETPSVRFSLSSPRPDPKRGKINSETPFLPFSMEQSDRPHEEVRVNIPTKPLTETANKGTQASPKTLKGTLENGYGRLKRMIKKYPSIITASGVTAGTGMSAAGLVTHSQNLLIGGAAATCGFVACQSAIEWYKGIKRTEKEKAERQKTHPSFRWSKVKGVKKPKVKTNPKSSGSLKPKPSPRLKNASPEKKKDIFTFLPKLEVAPWI